MKLKTSFRLCVFLWQLIVCYCFFGSQLKDRNYKTKTHKDITTEGVLNAISQYIEEQKGSSSIDNFYKQDQDFWIIMMGKVNVLGTLVSNTQVELSNKTYIHCHSDQIHLAHTYLKSCKQKFISRKGDTDELLKQLGECLYTLQSFYSNTNWVEMNGAVAYTDFGVNDLMPIISEDQASCKDMESTSYDCKDNILVTTKLTSGYHDGRGSIKPPISMGLTEGKCSHGGPEDPSRERVAKCGINKDSVTEAWSPHYHLHNAAFDAAVNATTHFLIAPETGILNTLGADVFDKLFHVITRRHRVSLSFAVDYTGSMSNDINDVKEQSVELVKRTLGTENAPENYVLALFNDPENLTYGDVYTNGNAMIQAISNIEVNGGGDCPEYAASGVLQAIDLSLRDSTVIVFSDADAKDDDRSTEVIAAALAKNIAITALLTGKCTFRKKRSALRVKRATSFFDDIANATGGKVYETSKDNLGDILNEVLEEIFPTSAIINNTLPIVIIDNFMLSSNEDKSVSVDDFVEVLAIHINDTSSGTDIALFYENGTNEALSVQMLTNEEETSIIVHNPPPGLLFLKKNNSNVWMVNVTAQSKLYADIEILEYNTNDDLISMQGNPITGNKYSITWTVNNLDHSGICQNIMMVDLEGVVLAVHPSSTIHSNFISYCRADIIAANEVFRVKLEGTDGRGYLFSRLSSTVFQPATVKLSVKASIDDAVVGRNEDIRFEVVNKGTDKKNYNVSFSDDHGFAVLPTTLHLSLSSGETSAGTFTVRPTIPSVIVAYTITVIDAETSEVQQIITKKLVVTDIDRPSCSIVSSSASCDDPSISSHDCSLYSWNSVAEVTFSGIQIANITSTGGSFVTLTHDVFQNVLQGPVTVNIKGHCCYPTVDISIIDIDGFISQCKLDFSYGREVFDTIQVETTPVEHQDDKNNILGVAVGISCAVVICVVVATVVVRWICKSQSKSMKVQDSHLNLHCDTNNIHTINNCWLDILDTEVKSDVVKKPTFSFSKTHLRYND